MATRTTLPRRKRTVAPRRVRAARAVDRVLSSEEALALLLRRLEAAGWHIEREPETQRRRAANGLTPPARAR